MQQTHHYTQPKNKHLHINSKQQHTGNNLLLPRIINSIFITNFEILKRLIITEPNENHNNIRLVIN